jgi:flagellar basal-body rod modification protein FlgD
MAISPLALGGASASVSGSAAGLADNFETFLTLLTEQMKNQDPLSPMDSTQFVNQLVQFSSVEQQINQNKNLEALIGLQLAASQSGAAAYLGRDVSVSTPLAELTDGEASWSYSLPRAAAEGKLVIENAEGKIVRVADSGRAQGAHEFIWDGKDNTGVALPNGVYRLSVAALDSAGDEIAATTENRGRVTAVDFTGEGPVVFIGKVGASLADVLSLRESAPDGA